MYIGINIVHGNYMGRKHYGPKGRPNNLPQPAWRLAELFFWSDLSWSRADLCAKSYVISTRLSLLSMLPSCMHYISYVGILRIIHNILFRIIRLYDNEALQIFNLLVIFHIFWFLNNMYLSTDTFFWYFISWCFFWWKKVCVIR